ncbi:MAG: hypothetical protein ABIR30_06740 [Chitinophagaceae bacterium]
MKSKAKIFSVSHLVSAVFMVLALLWLTVSTPFVFASQQHSAKYSKTTSTQDNLPGSEEESANPFGNSTEEKRPGSNSLSEEYLHDMASLDPIVSIIVRYRKCENADEYHAFHGELLVPPPNAA